jgi:TDG/mug DNA glycosylase family protein
VAFESGVGFTDIVKRPTASASEIAPEEFHHGRFHLVEKLEAIRPQLVIFTFKKTAETYAMRTFAGYGFVPGLAVAERPAFVMPGPYERRDRVDASLTDLTRRLT